MSLKLHIGCGQSPIEGWRNYDNSLSVRLASLGPFAALIGTLGLWSQHQRDFMALVRQKGIRWANAVERIPEPDDSADVIYSCHMLEHLERSDAERFLREARRVLKSGGIVRIAVPDIRYHIDSYLDNQDADSFIEGTLLTNPSPRTPIEKLRFLMVGNRHHLWMYDGPSLCRLLSDVGFVDAQVMDPGTTTIADAGDLDLNERSPESVFAEAVCP